MKMANENNDILEIYFPAKGLNEASGYSRQPELTSPFMINVRLKDSVENRDRGGSRMGLSKVFTTQAGSDRPVVKIVQCVNTYVQPV